MEFEMSKVHEPCTYSITQLAENITSYFCLFNIFCVTFVTEKNYLLFRNEYFNILIVLRRCYVSCVENKRRIN